MMRFQAKRADLCAIAAEAVAAFERHAARSGFRLGLVREVSAAPVTLDEDRLGQAIGNLRYNVAKYAPPGSEITVALLELAGGRAGGWWSVDDIGKQS